MTSKQRLLAAMKGQSVDRVPWSPFLAYYWEHLPQSIQQKGQFDYLKKMGADPLLRGSHALCTINYQNCNLTEKLTPTEKFITYETPVGTITERHQYSPDGDTWFLVDHPVKTEEDIKVLQYIYEHLTIRENTAPFEKDAARYGDEALLLPMIGVDNKTAFQTMVEHWLGTEQLAYAVYDYPEAIAECLAVMQEKDFETIKIAAGTSAEGFIFYEDSSTTNISPAMFAEYTAPEIAQWGDYLHKSGKLLAHHACGHIKDLLPLMAELPIDLIESISPPPTGNISIADALPKIPDRIGLIGGIEPTVLLNSSLEELERYVTDLLTVTRGHRFILANSDSCPPDVSYDKFLMISRLVASFGSPSVT